MAVEAVVALRVDKLAELLRTDAQLLGMRGEINRIREELDKMRPFLKDADIRQKEDEAVRDWMEDIRDICFDVDDVIDILGLGQAAQGRHGFVERLKRCIRDQITRNKVSKEIERIKLSIEGISRSRESYGIREINEERQEANSSTQRLQEEVSRCSVTPEEMEIVITTGGEEIDTAVEAVVALMVDKLDKLLSKEAQLLGVHGGINWIREELNQMRRFLKEADIKQKEDEDVRGWMEDIRDICFDVDNVIDILGQGQAAQGRHGFVERLKRCIGDQITRYKVSKEIERIKLSIEGISRSRESYGTREINEERQEATSSTQRLQEVSMCSVPPEKIEIVITTVDDQLTNEECTRDIDEGRQEASCSSRNLQAHRGVSTLPGEPEEVCLQEEINTVGQQLIEEEPRLWDGTRDISEGKLEASSSTPGLKADRRFSTLLGDSEEVGLQEGINTVGQQFIKEEPGPYDGTRDFDEGRIEASSSAPCLQADRQFSTLLGESEEVGLKEELYKVSQQLIKEEPSPCDGTRDIVEGRQEENLWQLLHSSPWSLEQATKAHEAAKAKGRLQEVSRCSGPPPPEKIEIVITTVSDQLTNEERTRDIDEGRKEASSSSRNLEAHRPVSTLPGEPEEVGLQEESNTVGQQLIEEEPRLWDGSRDISEGKLEASSSTSGLKADRVFSTLLGDSEDVGLQEGINTVGQEFIKEEPGPYDGTRNIDEGRLEAGSSAPCLQADWPFSTLLGESEERLLDWSPWSFEEDLAREAQEAETAKKAKAEAEAKREVFLDNLLKVVPSLHEISRRSVPPPPEKIEIVIPTVNDQLTNEERTRDIDEGRQGESSSSRNLQAHRPVSTLPGEPEEVGFVE